MKVAVTAPGGDIKDREKLRRGLAFLEKSGFECVLGETLDAKEMWTAGSAELRAAELRSFWTDPQVDYIWAARGGFGCIHLLPHLDFAKMAASPHCLVGHSDLTIVHLAMLKEGGVTVSGLMAAHELAGELDEMSEASLFSALGGEFHVPESVLQKCVPRKKGFAQGLLVPVTLSVACSMLATPYFPDLNGAILLIEDVNEAPYRLDAYLSQLQLAGILESLGALVFGDFSNCGESEGLEYLIEKFSKYIKGPVFSGLQFGHCMPRISVPCGIIAKVVVKEGYCCLARP